MAVEMPQLFVSARGRKGLRSEGVQKLYYMAGLLRGLADVPVYLYRPSRWKGNVPKIVTLRRLSRRYDISLSDNNESDAIGIADYHIRSI